MVNVKKIIKILIIFAFAVVTLVLAQFHEPWSDEAQSFLIARDTTIFDVFHYMKYEGTPPLWVLTIKIFLLLGGTYEFLYLIPIFFSIIGLIIFEFKVKAPWYIKLLFPFTYFLLYQNTIIRRSYSLVFPALMFVAATYEKRLEKPILYSVVLLFLMNISLHTLVISGSLYFLFLMDIIKNKKYKDKKVIFAAILIFIELGIAALMTYPAEDCNFTEREGKTLYYILSEATIGSGYGMINEAAIACVVILIFTFLFEKEKKFYQIFEFCVLFIPLTLVFTRITYQGWHIGILWLLIFTYFILKDMINTEAVVKNFVAVVCIFQFFWSMSSYMYDLGSNYSASKDVANFIKEQDYENLDIYGWGYSITAIQPYFEKNIFDNIFTDKCFWHWNDSVKSLDYEDFWINQADIYVISSFYMNRDVAVSWLDLNKYEEHYFDGNTYFKDRNYENEGYYVFVKK